MESWLIPYIAVVYLNTPATAGSVEYLRIWLTRAGFVNIMAAILSLMTMTITPTVVGSHFASPIRQWVWKTAGTETSSFTYCWLGYKGGWKGKENIYLYKKKSRAWFSCVFRNSTCTQRRYPLAKWFGNTECPHGKSIIVCRVTDLLNAWACDIDFTNIIRLYIGSPNFYQ